MLQRRMVEMAQLKPVIHQNFIIPNNQTIFCKKKHELVNLMDNLNYCDKCTYIYGSLQGNGVECAWLDIFSEPYMQITDPQREFERVSSLVENKILERG